jgi:hypothetical protein
MMLFALHALQLASAYIIPFVLLVLLPILYLVRDLSCHHLQLADCPSAAPVICDRCLCC